MDDPNAEDLNISMLAIRIEFRGDLKKPDT